MDRERLDSGLERGILAGVLVTLLIAPVALGGVRGQDFALAQAPLLVTVVLWVIRLWANPDNRLLWPPATWGVIAFTGLAVARYLHAEVEYVARLELVRIVTYAWLFLLVVNNLHRQETVQWLLGGLLVLGTCLSLYAVYQFLSGSNRVLGFLKPAAYLGRSSGTYICPNHLAGLLEMLLPVAVAGLILGRGRALGRVFYGYAALAMLAGLAVTVSRGGYFATGVALGGMLVFLLRSRRSRWQALAVLLVMATATAVFFLKNDKPRKRFEEMIAPVNYDSSLIRHDLWKPAVAMWRDHPWWGVGPGHYDVYFGQYRSTVVQSRPTWAHNDYVNALADWGVVGAGLIAFVFVAVGTGAARTWGYVQRSEEGISSKGSDRAAVVLGAATGLMALLIQSWVDFNWHIPANAMIAVTLLAVLTAYSRFSSARFWLNPRWYGRTVLSLAAAATLWFLIPQSGRLFQEGSALTRFERAREPIAQLTALHAAWAAEPGNPETLQRIGEIYRIASWQGLEEWPAQAQEAIKWFDAAIRANPHDPFSHYRRGMALDWLGRHDEATPSFAQAVTLDPNNHYVALMRGWHEMQRQDWGEAKKWLERSLAILPWANWLTERYLVEVNRKLNAAGGK